jgi:hypothetical protein
MLRVFASADLLSGESAQANRDAIAHHKNPGEVVAALKELASTDLLSGESAQANRDAIVHHKNPRKVAAALQELASADLLSGESAQANRDAIAHHKYPREVAAALKTLASANLLLSESAQANRDAIAHHINPRAVAAALKELASADLLSGEFGQTNWNATVHHENPEAVAAALKTLALADLLSGESAQVNRDAIAHHINPREVAAALRNLASANLLSGESAQANRDAIAHHKYPGEVAAALRNLASANLLSGESAQANRDVIVHHEKSWDAASALTTLASANLLSGEFAQANRDAIAHYSGSTSYALRLLLNSNLLNQYNFNSLMDYYAILLSDQARDIWLRLPRLSADQLRGIFTLCGANGDNIAQGQHAFQAYVDRILGINNRTRGALNSAQSTHTASVHKSVSKSVIAVKESYAGVSHKDLMGNVEQLREYIISHCEKTEDTLNSKPHAALRYLQELLHNDFRDPTSEVSTLEWLGLAWKAISDETYRYPGVTMEAGQEAIVNALYQIQRGYNLSEDGIDDAKPDSRICISGAFNKAVEALHGIDTRVYIEIINIKLAEYRLQAVVKEHLVAYLKPQDTVCVDGETMPLQQYLTSISKGMGKEVWEVIKGLVSQTLWGEFGTLFNSMDDPKFLELIAVGEDVTLTMDELIKYKLLPSESQPSNSGMFAPSVPEETSDEDDSFYLRRLFGA